MQAFVTLLLRVKAKKRRPKAPLKVGKQTKKLLISSQVNESQFLFDEASWLQE
jgi:hypothetical protein